MTARRSSATSVGGASPIVLGAYEAKRCARRIHNDADPSIERQPWEVPADLQARFDAGHAFEERMLADLVASLPVGTWTDCGERPRAAAIAATLEAMERGVAVILRGWLPDDPEGGRSGRPDLLIRLGDGYLPGDVKGHLMLQTAKSGEATHSTFAEPGRPRALPLRQVRAGQRFDDHLQLAHYWRMLQAAGWAAPGPARGVIIGTDLVEGEGEALTWLDLELERFSTYSRSRGSVQRSALQRYDHEFDFRLRVAQVSATGGEPLVVPVITDECGTCPWHDHCLGLLGDDDASAAITSGRLGVREWLALRGAGVRSIDDLADLDLDDQDFRDRYLPEVTHVAKPVERVAVAARRARLIRAGEVLEREATGPIDLRRADVEIDVDIEWDPADRVYLWGLLITRSGEDARYVPTASWAELDEASEAELAGRFVDVLRAEVDAAQGAGQSVAIYHYSNPEPTYLSRIAGRESVADLLAHFVDLLPLMRRHFFGVEGLGIKKVAPAFGFTWRDEDPGGLQSQQWLMEARSCQDRVTRETLRQRILDYNEDDVRATAAIRAGLSEIIAQEG